MISRVNGLIGTAMSLPAQWSSEFITWNENMESQPMIGNPEYSYTPLQCQIGSSFAIRKLESKQAPPTTGQ